MAKISKRLSKYNDLKLILIVPFLVFVLLLFFFRSYNPTSRYLLILFCVPVLLTLLLNFKILYKIFILSFFFEFGIYYFYLSTLLFPFVTLSFIINFSIKRSDIKNPILYYFLFFLISIIPSYFAAISHPESYLISYNLLGFISILFITPLVFTKLDNIKSIASIYLVGCTFNAIYLIIMALISGHREFGIAGIMYVDIVGIGIIISYSSYLFYKKHSFLFGIVTIILIVALLFTQTRNTWISTGIVVLALTIYYIFKKEKLKIKNLYGSKRLASVFLASVLVILIIEISFPNVFSRVAAPKSQTTEELAVTMDFGSIATRFFIWEIAFNVFKANPIIGTGFHSFRFVSLEYSKLDPFLYSTFVYNLTPHTTILALLADTGLLGFTGFMVFMYLTIRFFHGNLDQSITQEQKIISFILFWCQIYIVISMIMTDAWLWGTLHMLWAVILGISVLLRNDIKKTQALSSSSD